MPLDIRLDRVTMRRKVRNTSDSIALNLNIWAQHLTDERLKTSKLHDQELVVGWFML